MRRKIIITSAIATGVVITALIATPSLAAALRNGDAAANGAGARSTRSEAVTGMSGHQSNAKNDSSNHATGSDHAGSGMPGSGAGLTDVPSGTVTGEQATALAAMAAEEKLAHDLYLAFSQQYDAAVFTRILSSETKHSDAVGTLLERYDIADPTVGLAAGVFSTDVTQNLYDTLLAEGSVSLDAAMNAARTVEELDIADLTAATEGVTAPDVLAVYEHLLAASEHHLVAFGGKTFSD
ncbi:MULTISPECIES: ferritin-like domain-containing protein [Cryobacterium]|nr:MULTISPECIES: DUF2202 domain-containing protein [Cryobacterium]SEN79484.1 hypothetical protein SAMN05216281_11472 [Cryobacterium luteum]